jgi:formylglycine-generating enzyme required for sulfatase activity
MAGSWKRSYCSCLIPGYLVSLEWTMQLEQHASRRQNGPRMQTAAVVLVFTALAAILAYLYASHLQEFWRGLTSVRPYLRAQVAPYVLTQEAERSLNPLSSFRECAANCPEMIVLPSGEFTMGSPGNERGRYSNEGPPHKVVFAKLFAVSRFEVTFDDWDACAAYGDCDPRISDMGWGRGRRPIMNIDWNDSRNYAAWLSRVTGKSYRLPSEAEWEYAARAGSVTAYFWGDEIGSGNANCANCSSKWDGAETAPVGSFPANRFGLHDMHGNLWEWVEDCYLNSYAEAPADGSPWTARGCSDRVVRGGSWENEALFLRSAYRSWGPPQTRNPVLGFRVARTLLP